MITVRDKWFVTRSLDPALIRAVESPSGADLRVGISSVIVMADGERIQALESPETIHAKIAAATAP